MFKKKDEHPGSGIDKPESRGLIAKVMDKMKNAGQSQLPPKAPEAP
jgi:hypothetical protein